MINPNTYYQLSSQELMQARNDQSQISQKSFELRLMDINRQFSSNNELNYYFDNIQKQSIIKSDINRLINSRDNHLANAINYALDLALSEKEENNNFYSMAYLAVNSINSFLSVFNHDINFIPPISIMMKLSQVNFELTHKSPNMLLAKEIAELNKLCKGI